MASRFYTDQLLGAGEFVLDGPEAHHLAAVRRYAPGDLVTLFNGDGYDYPSKVLAVGKRSVGLAVQPGVLANREVGFPLLVAAAMPKGDRADFLIEKLTELGVTRFVPLVTTRSIGQPKVEKLRRAVIEASKQCGRNVLMTVDSPVNWCDFAAQAHVPTKLVSHTDGGTPIRELASEGIRAGVAVAVGPEGGFDAGEVEAAYQNGWRRLTLGKRVLRVETAACMAAACLAALGEE